MKTQLVLLMAFMIGFSACKKENAKQQAEETNGMYAARSVNISGPENPLNQYDSIGYWHNRILDYVQTYNITTDTPDVRASTQWVIKFYREEQGVEVPESFFSTVRQTIDDRENDFRHVIATCPYPEHVKAALDSLIAMLKRMSDEGTDYTAIKGSITAFEDNVMRDISLAETDRAIILKTASVARYSIYYWINILPSNPPSGQAFKFKNIVKWIAAVTSDIGGAIVSGNAGYAADCSSYAYDLVTYSMP